MAGFSITIMQKKEVMKPVIEEVKVSENAHLNWAVFFSGNINSLFLSKADAEHYIGSFTFSEKSFEIKELL